MRSLRGYRWLQYDWGSSRVKSRDGTQNSWPFECHQMLFAPCGLRNVCGKRGMALEAETILEKLLTSGVQADVVSCPQVLTKQKDSWL